MKTFQLNISDSCFSISDNLNVKRLLLLHKWFVLGENGYEELLTFQRSGMLILCSNEKEEKKEWIYNNKTLSLALRGVKTITRMLRPFFWDGYLLVFKLNAVDEYLFLVSAEKAHLLEINPLDAFETYASASIQKQKTDKRRKPIGENVNKEKVLKPLNPKDAKLPKTGPLTDPATEDPKTLIANTPGPVAQHVRPAVLPEKVVLVAEMEERIQEALEEQRIKLEERWQRKLDDAKDKYNAGLWEKEYSLDQRIRKALKEQSNTQKIEAHDYITKQKMIWKWEADKNRELKMRKIKDEVTGLKAKMEYELERNSLEEREKSFSRMVQMLESQRILFDEYVLTAERRRVLLEMELDIAEMMLDTPGRYPDNKQYDYFEKELNDSMNQCEALEKQLIDKNLELCEEKQKYYNHMLVEKEKYYNALKNEKKKTRSVRFRKIEKEE